MQDPAASNLELRDFFRALDFEQLQSLAAAIAESGREPELGATLRESAAAIPMINQVSREVNERKAAGDTENARVFQGQLILLMAIFRLAEDQGYRWHPPQTQQPNITGPNLP
jgi:hypothetical protein